MAAPFTITSVSNYNSNPPSDDGAQTASNRVQWSTQKSKLADPIKTAFDASESATSTAFGKVFGGAGITTTAVDYTVTASDQGKLVKCTVSGKTITTPDATVVGSPFLFGILNSTTGNITFAGNGSQTVDGASNIVVPAGCGLIVNTDGANWFTFGQNFTNIPSNYLSGLTLSTAGGSSTMSIAAGAAADTTNLRLMRLSSAYTKTTASWAVGTGNGGLDTGAIAPSTWYHFYVIERTDTNVVDVLFSLSASSPTLPTNYTISRRIGSGFTDGSSHWSAFSQFGDEFLWNAGNLDINVVNPGTSAVLRTMSVPTGVQVWVLFNAAAVDTSGSAGQYLFTSPDESDQAPSTTTFTYRAFGASLSGGGGELRIRTNTSAQIRTRCDHSNATTTLVGFTRGWIDTRGK